MFRPIADAVTRELSGDRAKNHAIEIHRSDRFSSFDRYRETAAYCAAQMRELGLESVESLPCRADGRTPYGDWLVPRSWDARSAELRIADTGHLLARYPDVPCSLYMYSGPTPPEGLKTELIRVDDIAQIPDSFAGKIIFTRSLDKEGRKALAARGIAGIVCDRGRIDFPDLRGWDNYTFAPRNEEGLFGFSLSHREAEHLRNRLERDGSVEVFVRVDTRLYDGPLDNVTGLIPGSEGEEEVLLLGHIYEQGANDNASGAGLGLEVFRTLKSLIDAGILPRPRRSLRLLLGFECCGLMGYVVEHPEVVQRTVAAINPDMVGEQVELCGASFGLHLTPAAAPSCVDALAVRLFEDLVVARDPLFRWREQSYSVCDSFVADPTIDISSVSIIGIPDRFYHSSFDTPDKISPRSLEQNGLVLATYLYLLADAGPQTAGWLAEEAASRGRKRLACELERALRQVQEGDPEEALVRGKERLPYLVQRHSDAIASAFRFGRDEKIEKKVERLQQGLGRALVDALMDLGATVVEQEGEVPKTQQKPADEIEQKAEQMTPRRIVVGPLTLEPLLLKEAGPFRWSPSWAAPHNDVLIWADGQRNLLEIHKCARLESQRDLDLKEVVDFFEFLARHGYVEWCDSATGEEVASNGESHPNDSEEMK